MIESIDRNYLEKFEAFLKHQKNIEHTVLIKRENDRSSFIYDDNQNKYFVKLYFTRKTFVLFKNIFRPSNAKKALEIALEIKAKNINVATPVAALTHKHHFIFKDSLLVTKKLEGQNLQEFLSKQNYTPQIKKNVLKKLADMWCRLYQNNFITTDPNLSGIMVHIYCQNIELAFVDMDNFKKSTFLSKKEILINLANFNAHSYSGLAKINQSKTISTSERLLFLIHVFKSLNTFKFSKSNMQFIAQETIKILNKWNRLESIDYLKNT